MIKKIFFFLILLTSSVLRAEVTDLSDLDFSRSYHIRKVPSSSYGWLYYNASDSDYTYGNQADVVGSGDAYEWSVYKSALGHYYLYNLSAKKFLTTGDGSNSDDETALIGSDQILSKPALPFSQDTQVDYYCPLSATASPILLYPTIISGIWYALQGDLLIGSYTAQAEIIGREEMADYTDQLQFEPSDRLLTEDEKQTIAVAVSDYETSLANIPVISSISTSSVSDLSELTEGSTVLIYSVGKGKYMYENATTDQLLLASGSPTIGTQAGMPYVFKVKINSDNTYSFESSSDLYIPTLLQGSAIYTSSVPESFTIMDSGESGIWYIQGTTNSLYFNANPSSFTGWSSSGGNSKYSFYVVNTVSSSSIYPIIYNCTATIGNSTYALGSRTIYADNNTIEAPSFPGLTLQDTDKSGVVTEKTVVNATYTSAVELPFVPTILSENSFADTTHWYVIKIGENYLGKDVTVPYALSDTIMGTVHDSSLWCFVGNVVDGFKI